MSKSDRNKPSSPISLWQMIFRRSLPLEAETTQFLLMSAGDVFMTYLLLRTGRFFESNPIAAYFFYGWGMKGMIGFKFAMAAFVCVIAQIIALKRLQTARRLLQFASLVVGVVVIYSFVLLIRSGAIGAFL